MVEVMKDCNLRMIGSHVSFNKEFQLTELTELSEISIVKRLKKSPLLTACLSK